MKLLLVILLSAVSTFADPSWNGLYATWNALPQKGFDAMPRSLDEKHNFVLKDNQCNGGKFLGQRYWSNNDPALILLFDKNGIIAGMQSSSPKSQYTPLPGMKGFVDDGDYWTQTAYFVEPSTICTKGRTKADLAKEGTGTGLWIQHGPDAKTNLINFPPNEDDIKKTLWGASKCFPSMGQHYWFNITVDMSCNNIFPNCLLYNNGSLNAFCFTKNVNLDSPLYDFPHPTNDRVQGFMNPVPKCFFSEKSFATLTTLHVYFHDNPRETTKC